MAEKASSQQEKPNQETKEPRAAEFKQPETPNLDPDFRVVLSLVLGMFTLFGIYFYYRIDLRNNGPFAAYINDVLLGGDPHKQMWLGVVQPEVRASIESVKNAMKATKSVMSSTATNVVSSARDEL